MRCVGNVCAVQEYLTGSRLLEAVDHTQSVRLPAAGTPEEREELTTRDVEIDTVHRGHLGELLGQLAQFDFAACHWSPELGEVEGAAEVLRRFARLTLSAGEEAPGEEARRDNEEG